MSTHVNSTPNGAPAGAPLSRTADASPPCIEEELHLNRTLLENLADQIPCIIFQYRIGPAGQRTFPYISPRIQERYGIAPDHLRENASPLLSTLHPDDRDKVMASIRRCGETMQEWRCEFRIVLPNSDVFWHQGQARPTKLADGSILWNGYIGDVTDKKAAEELIWRHANFDALTGLPNRSMFHSYLAQAITQAQRDNTSLALLFLDLDNFKDINDSLGHEMGDALLKQTAKRLRSCLRASDYLARIGGDEFLMMLMNMTDYSNVNRVTQEILRQFAEPFDLGEHASHVSASIGITFYPQDANGIDDLLKNADHAMYAAKQKGRNRFNYFTPAMQEKAQNRITLVNDLRAALTDYPFMLHYQPIVELSTGIVRKAEALIRWQHPTRGLVNPAEFIPTAEETGMIGDIGNWVCRTAASQVADWRALLYPDFQVSVNVSAAQFRSDDNALESWIEHLWQRGIAGQGVTVEITESLLLDASPNVNNRLNALRDAGIQLALDDFGTGYSSLSYLNKFDIDYIKIDRSFVSNMTAGSDDLALCEAIIVMAHKLGMKVVAEGVETVAQRDLLIQAGCDFAQGYLYSKPVPALDFENWLKKAD